MVRDPRFSVIGVSVEGYEPLWSPIKGDTPRPDARCSCPTLYADSGALAQVQAEGFS